MRRNSLSVLVPVLVIAGILLFRGDGEQIQRLSGFTMGTNYQVQIVDLPGAVSREQISSDIGTMLANLDTGIFSTYIADSELSRFNRHGLNEPFSASVELIEVLNLAGEIYRLTGGAFDVTVGSLVNLWGFGPLVPVIADTTANTTADAKADATADTTADTTADAKADDMANTIPDESQIAAAIERVGFDYLEIDTGRSEISKRRAIYVDLSAIAKGYAVDRVGDYLDSLGINNYFLEIGGELKMKGLKPGAESWVPAIETPRDSAPQIYELFYSGGEQIAVAGSGDYRNYFEVDGVRYSHEIDPGSGRPVTHNLAAAFVINDSAAKADALATAYMIMGLDAAISLIEREGHAAYLIYRTVDGGFDHYVSAEFRRYLGNRTANTQQAGEIQRP